MAPDNEAPARAFYDHESEQPRRRRRVAADWGVNEDIFDRMPSRFARGERRAEHQDIVIRRGADETSVAVEGREDSRRFERAGGAGRSETGEWARVDDGRGQRTGGRDEIDERGERTRGGAARGERTIGRSETGEWARVEEPRGRGTTGEVARVEDVRGPRAATRAEVVRAERAGELDPRAAARAVMSWGEDLDGPAPLVPGESRTIVLSRESESTLDETTARRDTSDFAALEAGPRERKTVKISGYPDRLPAARPQRPRTAVERIGTSPDRIAGYAVALGFLLVLIAVLTTGQ